MRLKDCRIFFVVDICFVGLSVDIVVSISGMLSRALVDARMKVMISYAQFSL